MLMSSVVVLVVALVVASVATADAAPVDQTRYGKSSLRLEVRPDPLWFEQSGTPFQEVEKAFAEGGVSARWVSVVDPLGCPYYKSAFIPTDITDLDKREETLKKWVADIHSRGGAVMSWYPLVICKSGAAMRPEWKQKFVLPEPEGHCKGNTCCPNTGYGQALIDFCNEAIDRFGLDGIWFDGTAWTQIWDRPIALSCACDDCKRLFKSQTGLDIPTKVDWSDATFRKWVAWRFDTFGSYLGRLSEGIRKKHPSAAVVVNHYHRPRIPWQSAIPLNPYSADIISGSEATGIDQIDVVMRLCRAYGRAQSEVWRPFDVGDDPDTAPQTDELIHHALACVTAGGMPSFGTGPNTTTVPKTAKLVSAMLDAVRPYVGGESVPYCALHLSQQSETFYFSRDPKGTGWEMEPYWKSIMGWTQGLLEGHISPDYIYDRRFELKNLKGYKLLLLPLSIALSDEQCRTALRFAEEGGTLVIGIGSGAADEWGERRSENPFEKALGFRFDRVPTPKADELEPFALLRQDRRAAGTYAALYSPLDLKDPAWKPLYTADLGARKDTAVTARPFGKGRVIVLGVDLGGCAYQAFQAVAGGDTSMAVTDETAAQGKHSLKFTDDPSAPQVFYPDMEMNFQPFGPPDWPEGRLSCDLRVEKGAIAAIELRNHSPKTGPSVHIGREGRLWAGEKALCDVPFDKWLRLAVVFRMAGENRTCDLIVTLPGEGPRTFANLPFAQPDFDRCDWAVIYGEGKEKSVFYLDDLSITASTGGPEPALSIVLRDDFEATPVGKLAPKSPVSNLAADLLRIAPGPIELDGPDYVRMGAFRRGRGETVVHLHNIEGSRLRPGDGPPVTLRVRFPVKSATLALSSRELKVERRGDTSTIRVPGVAMHEVVLIRQPTWSAARTPL